MLKIYRFAPIDLLLGKKLIRSWDDLKLEVLNSLYQPSNCCSQSGWISQNSLRVRLESTLIEQRYYIYSVFGNYYKPIVESATRYLPLNSSEKKAKLITSNQEVIPKTLEPAYPCR